ncbi:MAG: alpha/beta hydrolase [Balneolales bacterium]
MSEILIVFLGGAGLKPWIWENTIPYLDFQIQLVDYPGQVNGTLTIDDYYDAILQQIGTSKNQKIILVAHSIGGIFCNKLAEHLKDRLLGIVAIAAILPEKGETFLSSFPWIQRMITRFIITMFGTTPPDTQIKKGLCNDLPEEVTAKVISRFKAESPLLYTGIISESIPDCRSLYIILKNDKSIPVNIQLKAAQRLKNTKIDYLDSGHLPMLSQPEQVAKMINSFIDDILV